MCAAPYKPTYEIEKKNAVSGRRLNIKRMKQKDIFSRCFFFKLPSNQTKKKRTLDYFVYCIKCGVYTCFSFMWYTVTPIYNIFDRCAFLSSFFTCTLKAIFANYIAIPARFVPLCIQSRLFGWPVCVSPSLVCYIGSNWTGIETRTTKIDKN